MVIGQKVQRSLGFVGQGQHEFQKTETFTYWHPQRQQFRYTSIGRDGGIVDGSIVVTLEEVMRAMRIVAEKTRVIAEGAGALAVAAALSGKAGDGPIVAVISGGNIDLRKFAELIL